jgi:hypothetical protein
MEQRVCYERCARVPQTHLLAVVCLGLLALIWVSRKIGPGRYVKFAAKVLTSTLLPTSFPHHKPIARVTSLWGDGANPGLLGTVERRGFGVEVERVSKKFTFAT